jgi:hypothetical protein
MIPAGVNRGVKKGRFKGEFTPDTLKKQGKSEKY